MTNRSFPLHMKRQQVHEQFKSFTGTSIIELSKMVTDFAEQEQLAPKSLSILNWKGKLIASIGFRSDEAHQAVAIETYALSDIGNDLDSRLERVEAASGDVICHSLWVNDLGLPEVAFLIHGV